MIGIYKIENKLNGKVYIGQSINIEKRFKAHIYTSIDPNSSMYNRPLYEDFRKHGLNNFDFSIIEEINPEYFNRKDLFIKERDYIKKYNSYLKGYNGTEGNKKEGTDWSGDKNINCKLSTEDVYNIRELYNQKVPRRVAYESYRDIISQSGFDKIFEGNNWNTVHMDVYTEENKIYHKTVGEKLNRNRVHNHSLSEEQVETALLATHKYPLKKYYLENENINKKIGFSGFEKIIYKRRKEEKENKN